jgi:Na+-driven multidrug efflux pump
MGDEEDASVMDSHFWAFFYDGANMLLRSISLQASFFIASILASRLPDSTEALAAHGIIVQCWMLTSYLVDGFANVGTMLGGKFFGSWTPLDKHRFHRMTERLIFCGGFIGAIFAITMLLLEEQIIHVFTLKDSASRVTVISYLHKAWPVLCVMQPVNSLVFVYDGLIYAVQRFKYVRNLMVSGLLFAYAHVLAITYVLGYLETGNGLVCIWLAKSAMNLWRLGGLAVQIHLKL